jgi:hypothetical protein
LPTITQPTGLLERFHRTLKAVRQRIRLYYPLRAPTLFGASQYLRGCPSLWTPTKG